MAQSWYLDTADLIYRFRAGFGGVMQPGQPVPDSALRFLEDLLSGNQRLITNSKVISELRQGGRPDGTVIANWIEQNSNRVQVHQLSSAEFAIYSGADGGERSKFQIPGTQIPGTKFRGHYTN